MRFDKATNVDVRHSTVKHRKKPTEWDGKTSIFMDINGVYLPKAW